MGKMRAKPVQNVDYDVDANGLRWAVVDDCGDIVALFVYEHRAKVYADTDDDYKVVELDEPFYGY